MKILIISDVHGNVETLKSILKQHVNIHKKIFLGDFQVHNKVLQEELASLFDFIVQGNCDYSDVSPITQYMEIDGVKIMITHGHYFESLGKKVNFDKLSKEGEKNNIDIILHGHDHIEHDEVINGIRIANPGSTTFPRLSSRGSYAILHIEKGFVGSFEIIYI